MPDIDMHHVTSLYSLDTHVSPDLSLVAAFTLQGKGQGLYNKTNIC